MRCSGNLHALSLVHSFIPPVAPKRNFLVMREISVVISWMDPRLIVDFWHASAWVGSASSNDAVEGSSSSAEETRDTCNLEGVTS